MLLDDVFGLLRYWQKYPPPGTLIRAIAQAVGVEFPEPIDPSKHMTEKEARALIARTGGRVS